MFLSQFAEHAKTELPANVAPHVAELVATCEEALADSRPPAIDPAKRRDVIAEQPNPPAYVACFLHAPPDNKDKQT